ncbi:MAG: polysaccharide biosynthesis/export family protein, partial [Pseudomonadota bacterium]
FFEFVPPAPFSPTVSQVPLPQSPGVQNGPTLLKRPPKVEPQPYQIGVGDVLNVVSDVDVSELTRPAQEVLRLQSGYRVGNVGTIVVPSIGSVEVAGLTRSAAQKALFERLLSQGSDPGFSLNIQEFNSQSVSIGGDVGQPGRVAIKLSPLRLHEALAQSAGIRLRDDRQAVITIYRDREIYSIPVPAYKSNPSLQEILLVDGDAIFIEQNYDIERALAFFERQVQLTSVQNEERNGEMARLTQLLSHRRNAIDEQRRAFDMRHTLDAVPRDYVYLAGELEAQARFTLPYERHASLADALFSKGGFNVPFSDPSEIYLLRIDRKSSQKNNVLAFHLDSENAARLVLATELQLRPNDVIFIEEQPIAKWERALRSVFNIGLGSAERIVN